MLYKALKLNLKSVVLTFSSSKISSSTYSTILTNSASNFKDLNKSNPNEMEVTLRTIVRMFVVTLLGTAILLTSTSVPSGQNNSAIQIIQLEPPEFQANDQCLCPQCKMPVANAVTKFVKAAVPAFSFRDQLLARLKWINKDNEFNNRIGQVKRFINLTSGIPKLKLMESFAYAFSVKQLPRSSCGNCDGFFEDLRDYVTHYNDLLRAYENLLAMCSTNKLNPSLITISFFMNSGLAIRFHGPREKCVEDYNNLVVNRKYESHAIVVLISEHQRQGEDFSNELHIIAKVILCTIGAVILFVFCYANLPTRRERPGESPMPIVHWHRNQPVIADADFPPTYKEIVESPHIYQQLT